MRVKISDIAEELGLSTATVSNVIHGKTGKVSPETARRVQELLEKRQYIPSMAGILLAQNDSRIIGVVVNNHPKYESHVLEDGFIAASLNALSQEIDAAGYFMMVKATPRWEDIPRYASMWNMVGLVVIGFCQQDYQGLRDNMHIPFVVYDGFLSAGKGLVNLAIDDYGGGRQVGEHFRTLGHGRVLCVSDNEKDMDLKRFQGLRSVIPAAELLVIPMERQARHRSYSEKLAWLRSFTAIFAVSDHYAADLIHYLQGQGLSVPGDISVAGFDDSLLSRLTTPAITTVAQEHQKRAALAVELLGKLKAQESVDAAYTLPVRLIPRESTAGAGRRQAETQERSRLVPAQKLCYTIVD